VKVAGTVGGAATNRATSATDPVRATWTVVRFPSEVDGPPSIEPTHCSSRNPLAGLAVIESVVFAVSQ